MKTGKITAKRRDAVPVCLLANGEDVKRYQYIELPYERKEVEKTGTAFICLCIFMEYIFLSFYPI